MNSKNTGSMDGAHRLFGCFTVFAVIAGLVVPCVQAGTVFELKTVYLSEDKPEESTTIYLDNNRLRFEAMENGKQMTLIVTLADNGEPVCWIVDKAAKTYTEITKASADRVKAELEQGKRTMEEQIQRMPAHQQEQMRQMMKSQLEQFENAANIEFNQIASGVKIKKWTCVQYESVIAGEKHEDIWTADWKQIGIERSDAAIFRHFGSLFQGISPETNAFFHTGGSADAGGFDGFPVLVVEYQAGQKHEKSEVITIRSETLQDNLFELPEGLVKVSLFER